MPIGKNVNRSKLRPIEMIDGALVSKKHFIGVIHDVYFRYKHLDNIKLAFQFTLVNEIRI